MSDDRAREASAQPFRLTGFAGQRLAAIREEIRTNWARIGRDIERTQRLLIEARDLCRAQHLNFDKWCRRGELGIHKTQIYNLLNGRSSSPKGSDASGSSRKASDANVHRVNVLLGNTVDDPSVSKGKRYWLTPPARRAQIYRDWQIDYDACPHPRKPGMDSLTEEWGLRTYCNPEFSNPGPFIRKSIEEYRNGKLVLIVLPMIALGGIARLLVAGAVVYDVDIPDWIAIEDGSTSPLPPEQRIPCIWLVLIPQGFPDLMPCRCRQPARQC